MSRWNGKEGDLYKLILLPIKFCMWRERHKQHRFAKEANEARNVIDNIPRSHVPPISLEGGASAITAVLVIFTGGGRCRGLP